MDKSPERVEPTSPRMESPVLKILEERYSPRARLKGLPPFTLIHTYLAKCDSMPEKVIHGISEIYVKNVQNPKMIIDQRN
jgi:hypothetical protein